MLAVNFNKVKFETEDLRLEEIEEIVFKYTSESDLIEFITIGKTFIFKHNFTSKHNRFLRNLKIKKISKKIFQELKKNVKC